MKTTKTLASVRTNKKPSTITVCLHRNRGKEQGLVRLLPVFQTHSLCSTFPKIQATSTHNSY